jgi:hypothetical protein
MAYIGVSPSNGVRQKHTYTATANQTSFSGVGAENVTLSYRDSNYVDVYRNGVKLGDEDYTSTSGTAIVLAEGAAVNDIVEIIVYDVFSIADLNASNLNSGTVPLARLGSGTKNTTTFLRGDNTFATVSQESTVINNNADNRMITGSATENTLNGEANLTFDGTTLGLTGNQTVSGTLGVTGVLTANGGAVFNEASADVDFRVESNGNANMLFVDGGTDAVIIGHNASRQTLFNTTATAALQIEGTSGNTAAMSIARNSNDDNGPQLVLAKSNGTANGAVTVVTNSALLGRISFQGADGTHTVEGARIEGLVDGTPGANDMPGRLLFSTTADGAATVSERMRIDSSGNVGIGTSSPDAPLEIEGNVSSTTQFSGFGGLRIHNANGSAHGVTSEMYFTAGTGSSNRGAAIGSQFTSAASGNDLYFATNGGNVSSTNTLSERMRITSAGNVGIGTSSPQAELHVHDPVGHAKIRLSGAASDADTFEIYQGIVGVTNGGLTIRDVEASADRLVINSSGNVGIGTSSPNTNGFHVERSASNAMGVTVSNTEGTGSRFDLYAFGSNPAISSAHRNAIYQWTGAGIDLWSRVGDLHFGTVNVERMRIDSIGEILFGTTSRPSASVGGASFEPAANSRMILNLGCQTSAGRNVAVFRNTLGAVGTISLSGYATTYATSSDYRLKENVVTEWDATTRLKQLKPSRFNFIADADKTVDGFLAHEAQAVVPECVTGTKDALDADGNPDYQGIDQSKLVPLLVKTIQELEARITALEGA